MITVLVWIFHEEVCGCFTDEIMLIILVEIVLWTHNISCLRNMKHLYLEQFTSSVPDLSLVLVKIIKPS